MDILAPISRHVISRIYSLKERSKLLTYLRELEQTQWLPLEQLRKRQMSKLKCMLIHAYETVDFYNKRFSDAGFDPYKIKKIDQLQDLPLLTKKNISDNMDQLVSKKYKPDNMIKACTGGSTGTQLHFYNNKESVDKKFVFIP